MTVLVQQQHTYTAARFRVLLLLAVASFSAGEAASTIDKDSLPPLSYSPGLFSEERTSSDERVFLSNGLSAKPIAFIGEYVALADGTLSTLKFHKNPDAAGVFELPSGGWLYVSNAESQRNGTEWDDGGVGAIEFNEKGELIGYYRVANYTNRNCGGGKTMWNSWISGEEVDGGRFVQVDPLGVKPHAFLDSFGTLGWYESFAYDNHTDIPQFYTTRDYKQGIITRFTPDERGYECYLQSNDYDRWCTLEYGTIDYLFLREGRRADYTSDLEKVNDLFHRNTEGIDIYDGVLYFTAKKDRLLYVVKLLTLEYDYEFTIKADQVSFEPDQIVRIEGDDALYFCEEGGDAPGIHVRHGPGQYTTLLYIDEKLAADAREEGGTEETTGIAFSPDAMHMYVAFQEIGILYDVTRDDMRSFRDEFLGSGSGLPSVWIILVICGSQALALLFL